jgi:hypothetical protein
MIRLSFVVQAIAVLYELMFEIVDYYIRDNEHSSLSGGGARSIDMKLLIFYILKKSF